MQILGQLKFGPNVDSLPRPDRDREDLITSHQRVCELGKQYAALDHLMARSLGLRATRQPLGEGHIVARPLLLRRYCRNAKR